MTLFRHFVDLNCKKNMNKSIFWCLDLTVKQKFSLPKALEKVFQKVRNLSHCRPTPLRVSFIIWMANCPKDLLIQFLSAFNFFRRNSVFCGKNMNKKSSESLLNTRLLLLHSFSTGSIINTLWAQFWKKSFLQSLFRPLRPTIVSLIKVDPEVEGSKNNSSNQHVPHL